MAGDLNARVKDFQDFISNDDLRSVFNEDIQYPSDSFDIKRNSMDTQYNRFGLSLIELCCTYDVHILNGRTPGDKCGNFTCIANNGSSLVDYMICSTDLFKHVSNFQVLENDLTVHFPIQCTMLLSTCSNVVLNHSSNVIEWEQYRWKSIHAENFKSNFLELSDIFKLKIN